MKEYPDFKNPAKNIIKEKRDNGKSLYNYLLNECGCVSKYNKIAEYVDYKNEDELLYDEPMKEYSDDPFQDYDMEQDESERWDHFNEFNEGDDVIVFITPRFKTLGKIIKAGDETSLVQYNNDIHDTPNNQLQLINSEEDLEDMPWHIVEPYEKSRDLTETLNEMPKYWVAEKDGKKRFTECSSLNEDTVKGEIQSMEKEGYKMTAFKNEADMQKYLSNSL